MVSLEEKRQQILQLVSEYIQAKHSQKTWSPGKDWIQYAGPVYDQSEYVRAIGSLLKEWLVLGEDSMHFENIFPKSFGKEHGILTNSGSSSNLLMMAAWTSKRLTNFPKGTKVLTPIAGFPTTVNPILQMGFEPVFIDIHFPDLNLDVAQLEAAAKSSGARILTFAHVLGNPPNMDEVMSIVRNYDLILLEDCCDALGSTWDGKPLGSFGEMTSCSFYPAHHITIGEGGFVATRTLEQERVVRSFREWGRGCYCVGQKANLLKDGTCKKRFGAWLPAMPGEVFDHKFVYEEIGYNLKPIELQGSIGLAQLKKVDTFHARRRENFRWYSEVFKPYEEFFVLPQPNTAKANPSWFAYPLTLNDRCPFKRNELTEFYEDHKVQTRNYFAGNIMYHPGYTHLMDTQSLVKKYPIAHRVSLNTFFLGAYPGITPEKIQYVAEVTRKFFKEKGLI